MLFRSEEQRIRGKIHPLRKEKCTDSFAAFQKRALDLSAAGNDDAAHQFLTQLSHSGNLSERLAKIAEMSPPSAILKPAHKPPHLAGPRE